MIPLIFENQVINNFLLSSIIILFSFLIALIVYVATQVYPVCNGQCIHTMLPLFSPPFFSVSILFILLIVFLTHCDSHLSYPLYVLCMLANNANCYRPSTSDKAVYHFMKKNQIMFYEVPLNIMTHSSLFIAVPTQ